VSRGGGDALPRPRLLPWAGLVLAPLGMVADHALSLVLVSPACAAKDVRWLFALSALGLLLALGGGLLSWSGWRQAGRRAAPPDRIDRDRFVAALGMLFSALLSLALLLILAAKLTVSPCAL
jgi:hypothetical protein